MKLFYSTQEAAKELGISPRSFQRRVEVRGMTPKVFMKGGTRPQFRWTPEHLEAAREEPRGRGRPRKGDSSHE